MDQYRGRPEEYWNSAGAIGYGPAMGRSGVFERHIRQRVYGIAIDIADEVGIPANSRVLDYGCGDGTFANSVLASRYGEIHGLDLAPAAIARAQTNAPGAHLKFATADLVSLDYGTLPRFEGAFLMGILHHIKEATPRALRALASVTDRLVILEPNGDHIVRKLLEYTPDYRRAGEDSFRTAELLRILDDTGWERTSFRRVNIFPNFTPDGIYRLLAPLEPAIEKSTLWNRLCTVNMLGVVSRRH